MPNNEDRNIVVFVSNVTPALDYTRAASYGALRPITSGRFPIFRLAELQTEIVKAVAHSKETDYLLISGSSIVGALCLAAWLMAHKQCNLLLFDKSKDVYLVRVVSRVEIQHALETARVEIETSSPAVA